MKKFFWLTQPLEVMRVFYPTFISYKGRPAPIRLFHEFLVATWNREEKRQTFLRSLDHIILISTPQDAEMPVAISEHFFYPNEWPSLN